MAKKTEEEIKAMVDLYNKLGVYSKVAKELGVSPATVSKYVKEAKNLKLAVESAVPFNMVVSEIDEIPFPTDWKKLIELSKEEWEELKELQKEIVLN